MSFVTGFTKGFIRQSEMNQARREKEADRELSREAREEDRKHDFDLLQKKMEADAQKTISALRVRRAAAETASGSSVNQYKALETLLQGTEGSQEYLSTVAKDPRVASQILEKVTDIQERSSRALTPDEIINYITPIVTEKGPQVITFDDELEQLMYEDALSEVETPEPAVAVTGNLYEDYTKAEVELAEDNFTSAMLDLARKDVEQMSKSGESKQASDVLTLISKTESGDKFAMSRLSNRYGNTVIADFYVSMQDNPFLRPIIASGAYGSRIQRFDTIVQRYNNGELSPEDEKDLQTKYPQVFK